MIVLCELKLYFRDLRLFYLYILIKLTYVKIGLVKTRPNLFSIIGRYRPTPALAGLGIRPAAKVAPSRFPSARLPSTKCISTYKDCMIVGFTRYF